MDDQLRRTLSDKLDGLSAADLVPDFDRLQTWDEIERRMDTVKPVRRSLPVWTYVAAAALAGLIIGGLGIRFFTGTQQHGSTQITHSFAPAMQIPAALDTPGRAVPVGDIMPSTRPAAGYQNVAAAKKKRSSIDMVAPAATNPKAPENIATVAPTPLQQTPPQADSKPQRPRARHLLDIDAQSRTAVLNDQSSAPQAGGVSQYIMVRTMPPAAPTEAPAAILPRFK